MTAVDFDTYSPAFKPNDRVWCRDNGPDDMGTVTRVVVQLVDGTEYVQYEVEWDAWLLGPDLPLDTYTLNQLGRL